MLASVVIMTLFGASLAVDNLCISNSHTGYDGTYKYYGSYCFGIGCEIPFGIWYSENNGQYLGLGISLSANDVYWRIAPTFNFLINNATTITNFYCHYTANPGIFYCLFIYFILDGFDALTVKLQQI